MPAPHARRAMSFYVVCDKLYATTMSSRSCGRRRHEDANAPTSYLHELDGRSVGFVRCLSVRLHNNSPTALVGRALKLVGCGMESRFFFNDDVLNPRPGRQWHPYRRCRDYAALVLEITIPGRQSAHASVTA